MADSMIVCVQDFEQVCSILSAILNIGDIRIESDFHSHIGEVSTIPNKIRLGDGTYIHTLYFHCNT